MEGGSTVLTEDEKDAQKNTEKMSQKTRRTPEKKKINKKRQTIQLRSDDNNSSRITGKQVTKTIDRPMFTNKNSR